MSPEDLDHIPKTGPVVVIANHPFGLVEGIYLTGVIARLRPDSLIMVNSLLGIFAAYVHKFILVNPFGTEEAKRENLQGLRKSVAHLRNGELLAVFPTGELPPSS